MQFFLASVILLLRATDLAVCSINFRRLYGSNELPETSSVGEHVRFRPGHKKHILPHIPEDGVVEETELPPPYNLFNYNPLHEIKIGTSYAKYRLITPPNIEGDVRKMVPTQKIIKSVRGTTPYIHFDDLNYGSFGIYGSYGSSANEKIASTASVYVKKSNVNKLNLADLENMFYMVSGVEYIDFNMLKVGDMVNSLTERAKRRVLDVLEYFNAAVEVIEKGGQHLDIDEALKKWNKKLQLFHKDFGHSLTVGVIWGSIATVSFQVTEKNRENIWKFGGNSKFVKNSPEDITLKQAFSGGRDRNGTLISLETKLKNYMGGGKIEGWYERVVKNKNYSDLADAKLYELMPDISDVKSPPKINNFKIPPEDPKTTEILGRVDLKFLEEFSKFSGLEKVKEDMPELKFEEFNDMIEKNCDLRKLVKLINKLESGNFDTTEKKFVEIENTLFINYLEPQSAKNKLSSSRKSARREITSSRSISRRLKGKETSNNGDSDNRYHQNGNNSYVLVRERERIGNDKNKEITAHAIESNQGKNEYTVLGAWIVKWSDIFPWMSTGYLNTVADTSLAEERMRRQILLQDLLTLSKMYHNVASCNMDLKKIGINYPIKLAEKFQSRADFLSKNFFNHNIVNLVLESLHEEAGAIYENWNEIKILRNSALGLGLVFKKNQTIKLSFAQYLWRNAKTKMRIFDFDSTRNNLSIFSDYQKLIPLIGTNKGIYAFTSCMMLSNVDEKYAWFRHKISKEPIKFGVNFEKGILENVDKKLELYPIPFSAAENKNWIGKGFSTNLPTEKLEKNLKKLASTLQGKKAVSLSSQNWDKNVPLTEGYYSLKNMKTEYLGLVEEIPSVFSKAQ